MFALSGITIALSSAGCSRWKTTGFAVLIVVVMFVANTIGWASGSRPASSARYTLFYYQPQKAMLDGNWMVNLGAAWDGGRAPGFSSPWPWAVSVIFSPAHLHSPRLAAPL